MDTNGLDNALLEITAVRDDIDSCYFTADLARIYERFAESRGWRTEILETRSLGYHWTHVTLSIAGRSGTWPAFEFESGLHQARRYSFDGPPGRIVKVAAEVLAYPECRWWTTSHLDPKDIRIDQYNYGRSCCGNGSRGAVRLTHLPTGITADSEGAYTRAPSRQRAMELLSARLSAVTEGRARTAQYGRLRTNSATDHIRPLGL